MILAQLGLGLGDPLQAVLGCFLVLAAVAVPVLQLVFVILLIRRRISPNVVLLTGAASVVVFGAYVIAALWAHPLIEPIIMAVFLAPVVTGLVTMLVVLRFSRGVVLRVRAGMVVLVLPAAVVAAAEVRYLFLRVALHDAVLAEDVTKAHKALARGAVAHRGDEAFRQQVLVDAARDVHPDLADALLAAGADPNVDWEKRTPLIAAINSDPILRVHSIDRNVHAARRLRTVRVLLDHGANPNGALRDGVTPAEAAWFGETPDILALLEERGATDTKSIPGDFEALMRAAGAGDLQGVRALISKPAGRHPEDPSHRAPLVAAAANGHLEVVEALLRVYGDASIQCRLLQEAKKAAEQNHYPAVAKRLSSVCS